MTPKPNDPIQRGLLVAAVASALVAGACGGKDEVTNASAKTSASASPTSSDTTNSTGRGGPGGTQFKEIQKCLKAAGLEDKMPKPPKRPSGDASKDDARPTDRPSGPPPGGKGGDGPAAMQDPEVQAALKACGIEMPPKGSDQRPPQGAPPR